MSDRHGLIPLFVKNNRISYNKLGNRSHLYQLLTYNTPPHCEQTLAIFCKLVSYLGLLCHVDPATPNGLLAGTAISRELNSSEVWQMRNPTPTAAWDSKLNTD
ncbi:hypothetical protein [Brasilonema bromeliae]|uniref:hypothetical protein n=1 Tax=Brasilonema bromeliae TaxID=383615 RepID=UPI001B7CEF5C|nr:hypothetical protein [Brasilonema bromeliae]